jgi:hypothetical protein
MPHDSFLLIVKLIFETSLIRKVKQQRTAAPLCKSLGPQELIPFASGDIRMRSNLWIVQTANA